MSLPNFFAFPLPRMALHTGWLPVGGSVSFRLITLDAMAKLTDRSSCRRSCSRPAACGKPDAPRARDPRSAARDSVVPARQGLSERTGCSIVAQSAEPVHHAFRLRAGTLPAVALVER
jgi:hypothetical protein